MRVFRSRAFSFCGDAYLLLQTHADSRTRHVQRANLFVAVYVSEAITRALGCGESLLSGLRYLACLFMNVNAQEVALSVFSIA